MQSSDRFQMPAEFGRHSATWLLWPVRPDNWRNNAAPAQASVVQLAASIGAFENVLVGVDGDHLAEAKRALPGSCSVIELEYDDTWIRDTGPVYVRDISNELIGLDWSFNSWGGLFESWEKDDSVAKQILALEARRQIKVPYVLEGGAVSVNGAGCLLTTEACLLSEKRNPQLTREGYEGLFRQYLGADSTIWLPRGLEYDETGGHVDNIAVFIAHDTVALAWTDDMKNAQFERCREAHSVLQSSTFGQEPLKVIKIPLAPEVRMTEEEARGYSDSFGSISRKPGDLFSASYINFYFVNGGLILPRFGCDEDLEAVRILKEALPHLEVVQVDSREFILGGGGPHCLTQQVPELVPTGSIDQSPT